MAQGLITVRSLAIYAGVRVSLTGHVRFQNRCSKDLIDLVPPPPAQYLSFSITRLKPPASSRLALADKMASFGGCHGLQVWQPYSFSNRVSLCLGD